MNHFTKKSKISIENSRIIHQNEFICYNQIGWIETREAYNT